MTRLRRCVLLVAAIILLVSPTLSLLTPATTYAAGVGDTDEKILAEVKKYINAQWLVKCFVSNDLKKISDDSVNNYNWFAGQEQHLDRWEAFSEGRPLVPQISGAVYGKNGDSTRGCTGENLRFAFTSLGFPEDGRETYCSIPKSEYEGDPSKCINGGSGKWDNKSSELQVAEYIHSQVLSKNNDTFKNVETNNVYKYALYKESFVNQCFKSVINETYSESEEAGRDDYYKIPVVSKTADGKATLTYMLGSGANGSSTNVALTAFSGYDGAKSKAYKGGENATVNISVAGSALIQMLKDGFNGVSIPGTEKKYDILTKFKVPYGIDVEYWPTGAVRSCNDVIIKARSYAEAYRVWVEKNQDFKPEEKNPDDGGEADTSCDIDGVGWIVCPAMNFMAKLNDTALSFLGDNFLNITPGFSR